MASNMWSIERRHIPCPLGAVSLTTQRTQRNELLHGKGRPTMYKMETFKVAVLFVLLWKKLRRRKRKAYTLDKRYFFIRATKEANSVCSMYEHDHESFHHNLQSCQVWLYCSARLDRQRRQSDLCTSCYYQVKRRHVIGQTLRCLREIRTWVQLLSCEACVACVA